MEALRNPSSAREGVAAGKERLINDPDVERGASTAFLLIFGGLFSTGVLAAMAFVAWVNLWGNYGDVGTFIYYNDRRGKAEALLSKPAMELAEAWILGGSTIYPLQPKDAQSRFGFTFYSLASFGLRMSGNWAWLRFILDDLGQQPKLIILGLDTWTFRPENAGPIFFPHLRRSMINSPKLMRHLDEYNEHLIFLGKAIDLLSGQALRQSVRVTLMGHKRTLFRPAGEESLIPFEPDGTGPYREENPDRFFAPQEINKFYRELLKGTRSLEESESSRLRSEYLSQWSKWFDPKNVYGFFRGRGFAPRHVALLDRFVRECDAHSISLIICLLPTHPYFNDVLDERTEHIENKRELRALTNRLVSGHRNMGVFDALDLRSFNGDPMAFHDRLHMKPSNGRRVLDRLHELWSQMQR